MADKKLKSTLGRAIAGLGSLSPSGGEGSAPRANRQQPIRYLDAMDQSIDTQDVFEMDTERCVPWPFHNRLYELLTETECSDLIESIRTHGQLVPAIGRRHKTEGRADIEIVSGARRLWVARFLKIRIKVDLRVLTDEEAFVVSEDSNRYEDITQYERAIEYRRVLGAIFGGNQARMAARVNISAGHLSRFLALAELPKPIVEAFPDPRKITLKLAAQIRAAMNSPGADKRILAVASEIARKHEPTEAEAIARAILATKGRKPGSGGKRVEIKGPDGAVAFTLEKRSREVIVKIPKDRIGLAQLARLISEALGNLS